MGAPPEPRTAEGDDATEQQERSRGGGRSGNLSGSGLPKCQFRTEVTGFAGWLRRTPEGAGVIADRASRKDGQEPGC